MKRIITYIIFTVSLFTIFSCVENNKNDLHSKLQGDWLYNNVSNANFFISFRDSMFFGWENYNEFQPFYLKDDSVFVPFYKYKSKFTRVTDKYIWITKDSKEIPAFINTNYFNKSNLKLLSLEIRFRNFGNRGLYDWGLYLDKDRNSFIHVDSAKIYKKMKDPLRYKRGTYFSKLPQSVFDFYQLKFQNLLINRIKKEYNSNDYSVGPSCVMFDRAFVQLELVYGFHNSDKTMKINFIAKGYINIPDFLSVFIVHLNKIHDFVKFEEKSDMHEFHFYSEENYFNYYK